MTQRPRFNDAWDAFSDINVPARQVGNIIGGKVKHNFDIGAFANACTVRFSYVMNNCGCDVERSHDISTVSGGDGRWYMYRVRDALVFLDRKWGKPDVFSGGGAVSQTPFMYRKGLIAFEVPFNDANGHITLWDGKACADQGYFDRATRCSLWLLQ